MREKKVYEFDDFQLHPDTGILLKGGKRVSLSRKTFSVLLVLVENGGEVVTKERLFEEVWPETYVDENNLSVHIRKLRKDVLKNGEYIETISGVGYKFNAVVTEATYAPAEAGGAGGRRPLKWVAVVLGILLVIFLILFAVRKTNEATVRSVVKEAGVKEFSFYQNPKSFVREQLQGYWVMPEQGGLAAKKIESGVERLVKDGQVYGGDAGPEVFEVTKVSIPLLGLGGTAEVLVREVWYMPVYDGSGRVVRPDKIHQDFGETKYTLWRVNGRWLIYASSATYRNNQPNP